MDTNTHIRFIEALLLCGLVAAICAGSAAAADDDESANPRGEIRAREAPDQHPRPMSVRSRPSPETMAVREGLADALGGAVSFPKAIPTPPTGTWGIVSEGTGGGGIFRDSDSEAEAWLGVDGDGVTGFGSVSGGFFKDSDSTGQASVAWGDLGIRAWGSWVGGYFEDSDGSGFAYLAYDRPSGTDANGKLNDGEYGVYAGGAKSGGYFEDRTQGGYAYVGAGSYGIAAYGPTAAGFFENSGGSGTAYVGYLDTGVYGHGSEAGGYFEDSINSGWAFVGYGDWGIQAYGNEGGGYFADLDSSGWAYVGYGHRGIEARGYEAGGWFHDFDGSGFAYAAYDRASGTDANGWANDGEYGVYAGGALAGGYFENSDGTAYAYVGYGYDSGAGIVARGSFSGGLFADKDNSGQAYVGRGDRGIEAQGNEMGGYFSDSNQSGYAEVGIEDVGIRGWGNLVGGYFKDDNQSGRSWVGTEDYGIKGFGDFAGGNFEDTNSSSYGRVGHDTYKIYGTGSVSFVQNHPYDPGSVIVYAAPEGDEVATYTRGTASLSGGETIVPLGETFKWVTNPDIGLTAHVTPRSDCDGLYVAELTTEEIVVRELHGGTSDCSFDFLVYGLRIGFEETSIVQEKEREAYIPSMASHRQLYQRRPDLEVFSSLERFKTMRHEAGAKKALDLSRAQVLRDAIVEFDPAVHEPQIPVMEAHPHPEHFGDEDVLGREESGALVRTVRPDHGSRRAPTSAGLDATTPVDDQGNGYAQSFRPPAREVASLVGVSESVEPGDVLVIDRNSPGMMRRGFESHDSGVIGVVSENTGVVLGSPSHTFTDEEAGADTAHRAEVAMAGVVSCKVDAAFGAIWPGDLLVTSPTPGHAMRTESPLPGTIVGKAIEPLGGGTGLIRVLVMLR